MVCRGRRGWLCHGGAIGLCLCGLCSRSGKPLRLWNWLKREAAFDRRTRSRRVRRAFHHDEQESFLLNDFAHEPDAWVAVRAVVVDDGEPFLG